MRGIVRKDEDGNFIVVYHRECIEDSDAVIRVSCKLMPGFHLLFKEGDDIEFELIEFAQEDGSFSSYARPYLKVNPHISSIVNKNNEVDKKGVTLREKFGEVYIEKGMTKELEQIADEYAIEFAEWIVKNCNHSKLKFLDYKELLEIFKKEKGL